MTKSIRIGAVTLLILSWFILHLPEFILIAPLRLVRRFLFGESEEKRAQRMVLQKEADKVVADLAHDMRQWIDQ